MPPIPIVIALVVFILFVALEWAGVAVWATSLSLSAPPELEVPRDWMRIGVSLVLLIAALWVVLSKRYTPTDRHWACGTIDTIVGYWLGGS